MPLARQECFTVTDDLQLLREVAVCERVFAIATHTLPHTLAQMHMQNFFSFFFAIVNSTEKNTIDILTSGTENRGKRNSAKGKEEQKHAKPIFTFVVRKQRT